MKVPQKLADAFGKAFEDEMARFATERGFIAVLDDIRARRFLTRSVLPHLERLSDIFNRIESQNKSTKSVEKIGDFQRYWQSSSNPENLRLAYWLYYMPCNLFRVASVWSELGRLGFRWNAGSELMAIEFGAGPASGACGVMAGEAYSPDSVGLPTAGSWALIEQDRATLQLGQAWAENYWKHVGSETEMRDWSVRPFHRTVRMGQEPLLPRGAPQFNLWLSSYFLNELGLDAGALADTLIENWERHLAMEGVAILVEPALRLESRKLLELRKALIERFEKRKQNDFQILLPCLGHQACGALADPEDWCHEEVTWWRPPYLKLLDELVGLDKRTLPFSYLVIARSTRTREELLPFLKGSPPKKTYRLVSPSRKEARDLEFYLCGQEGKLRARMKQERDADEDSAPNRGDILKNANVRGDPHFARVE